MPTQKKTLDHSVPPTEGAPELQFRVDQRVNLVRNTEHPAWTSQRPSDPALNEIIAINVIVEDIVFNQRTRRFEITLDKRLGYAGITFDGVTGLQHGTDTTIIRPI